MSAVAGNPTQSKWRSTAQADRVRKLVSITLSDDARERLAKLAKKHGLSKSEVIEMLITAAPLR